MKGGCEGQSLTRIHSAASRRAHLFFLPLAVVIVANFGPVLALSGGGHDSGDISVHLRTGPLKVSTLSYRYVVLKNIRKD